jgi:hypothetical protein
LKDLFIQSITGSGVGVSGLYFCGFVRIESGIVLWFILVMTVHVKFYVSISRTSFADSL